MSDNDSVNTGPAGDAARSLISNLPVSLVLVDPHREDKPIVYVNRAFERVTGYSATSVIGRNCRFLQGDNRDQAARHRIREAIDAQKSCIVDIENYRADGSHFINRLMISPVFGDDGRLFTYVGVQTEVSDAVAQTGAVTSSLDASVDLLRETEHRVKNHLSMVSSMIRLEGRGSSSRETFEILARRVEALSLLYDEFSTTRVSDITRDVVSAGGYVSRVAATIGAIDGRNGIRLNVDCDTVFMRSSDAAVLGLLASEILSNVFKHAFGGREEGLVEVRLKMLGNDVMRLSISDDGVGMTGDWPKSGNDGAEIVRALVAQIDGEIGVETNTHGTVVTVSLPYSLPTEQTGVDGRVVVGRRPDALEG